MKNISKRLGIELLKEKKVIFHDGYFFKLYIKQTELTIDPLLTY